MSKLLSGLGFLVVLLALGGPVMAQRTPEQEAWRKRTLDTFRNAKPTAALGGMTAVDRLLAIEDIRQIPYRYVRCINQRDWDCWTSLFAADSDYWNSKLGVVKGPSGMYQHLVATGMTSDRVHSEFVILGGPEIELLSPTTARGIFQEEYTFSSVGSDPNAPPGEVVSGGQETRFFGIYYQTYGKIEGKWKIKSNIHIDLRSDKGPISPQRSFLKGEELPKM